MLLVTARLIDAICATILAILNCLLARSSRQSDGFLKASVLLILGLGAPRHHIVFVKGWLSQIQPRREKIFVIGVPNAEGGSATFC